ESAYEAPMTLIEYGFLALVFVLVIALVMGTVSLLTPSAAQTRLRGLALGPAAGSSGQRWTHWIAALTKPISKLSAPQEGFEKSSLRLRFMNAGLRDASAPA